MPHNTTKKGHCSRCRPRRGPIQRLFSRPPLAHINEADEIAGYWEAYDVFTPILRDFPPHLLDAVTDAGIAERERRRWVG